MLEEKITASNIDSRIKERIYGPQKSDLMALYGKINLYENEKSFASAKCCMCCS